MRSVGKYTLGKKLGSGTYGVVSLAVNNETLERVAIKVIKKDKIQSRGTSEMLKREITTMKKIDHPNVVKIYEVLATKDEILIVMELVEGGDLLDWIEHREYLDEAEAMRFFASMVQAVQVCHENGVCHRDIKPDNMMVTPDGRIKITDFGMAVLATTNLLDTVAGTLNYVAPEVLREQGYDGKKADIWSLGCVLFVMLAGVLPFEGQLFLMSKKIELGQHAPYPAHVSPAAREYVDFILNVQPNLRPSIDQLQQHPYFINAIQGSPQPRRSVFCPSPSRIVLSSWGW
eukprot:c18173_g1_i1.p1 GENE.c18173_g1_i1~~c18173_g1_i1.p1  ORF type:complete len:288 (+),score=68.95 c18173_g1_i1:134-997(+)